MMTMREAAAELAVSVWTVRRLIAQGRLRAIRVGWLWRIRREDLDAAAGRDFGPVYGREDPEAGPTILRLLTR